MGRRKKDQFEELWSVTSEENYFEDLTEGEEDYLELEDDLPDFVPTNLSFVEWVNAYSDALIPGGLIWDDASRAIAEAVERGLTTDRARQAIVSHSRSGKTVMLCMGLTWYMAKHNLPCIWATATGRLAEANIKKCILIFERAGLKLHPRMRSVHAVALAVKAPGMLRSVSVNAGLLGADSAVVVADDLCPSSIMLEQERFRERLKQFWSVDLQSRLTKYQGHPSQILFLVAQRLPSPSGDHLDLVIKASESTMKAGFDDGWHCLELPIIYPTQEAWEAGEHLQRYPSHWRVSTVDPRGRYGQPTSSRNTMEDVETRKHSTPISAWSSMFLCVPDNDSDTSWNTSWIKQVPKGELSASYKVVVVDPAAKGGEGRDETGVACVGIIGPSSPHRGKIVLLDSDGWSNEVHELPDRLEAYLHKWQPQVTLVEATAYGPELLRAMRATSIEFHGCELKGYRPMNKSKQFRLGEVIPYFTKGKVYAPEYVDWLMKLHEQFRRLSRGVTRSADDRADAAIAGIQHCANLLRSGWVNTDCSWSRGGPVFRQVGIGTVTWGHGSRAVGGSEGQFQTDPNQPFPGKSLW